MRVVRLKPYLQGMVRMGFDETAMREIESDLIAAPEAHPMIKGLRGVRKARIARPGKGKSGGGRVIYYVYVRTALYMMTAYPKNERDDLSQDQRRTILGIIDGLKEKRT